MTRLPGRYARPLIALVAAGLLAPAGYVAASPSLTAAPHRAGASSGHAKKPKPVCNLVVPKPSDTIVSTFPAGQPSDPSQLDPGLQLTSADVATKGNLLTVVWRVKKLTDSYGPKAPLGRGYEFRFVANGTTVGIWADESPVGSSADVLFPHAKATFDTARNQVRETVPLGDIAHAYHVSIVEGHTRLSNLVVKTQYTMSGPGFYDATYSPLGGDAEYIGPVPATYVAGTPSCVKVGS